jgi:hypothetical protein
VYLLHVAKWPRVLIHVANCKYKYKKNIKNMNTLGHA